MSEFDREAERKKLEEQFAEDEDDRAVTERMSELLLQGATMTDNHCETCRSPIFRYDGQAFCPTCQQPTGDGQASQPAEETTATEVDGPADREGDVAGSTPEPDQGRTEDRIQSDNEQAPTRSRDFEDTAQDTAGQTEDATHPGETRRSEARAPASVDGSDPNRSGTPGLGSARTALERTVTRLSRLAEESDDVGQTREYLAAAREAAEALEAIKRAAK